MSIPRVMCDLLHGPGGAREEIVEEESSALGYENNLSKSAILLWTETRHGEE